MSEKQANPTETGAGENEPSEPMPASPGRPAATAASPDSARQGSTPQASVNRRAWQELLTPANIVTITRILLVPAFIILMLAPWADWVPEPTIAAIVKPWVAAIVFILLAATDGLDGYLARSRDEVTTFGMLLDPLADKILVSAALLVLIELDILPAWIALVILGREFLVTGLRMVAAAEGKVIAASNLGKTKTVFQIIAVVTFIVKGSLETILNILLGGKLIFLVSWFAWIVMALTLVITIVSLIDYFINSAEVLGFERTGIWARIAKDEPSKAGEATESGTAGSLAMLADPNTPIAELTTAVLSLANEKGVMIGTAESCTGGLIAAVLTDIPGSSSVIKGSVVSYANSVKQSLLTVSPETIDQDGAVSEACVIQMAKGARAALEVDAAVSVSGIAGPDGGTEDKPVGTVWLAVSYGEKTVARRESFVGERAEIRRQAVRSALLMLYEVLSA
ncbi:MAG: CDP-diacylglycerol--glycerol-3-phosphate 3-phosphatidyltransferase [Coriobacteriia bacterium]|nr:CDP-diacylglycerol--glycerol-3-phosphate 3-phosphatidyltransferase [Coriobacteriia bacterium]